MSTMTSADAALASTLRIAVMRLSRRLRSQRTDTSLSASHLAALATLSRHGALSPGELAAHEKVRPPSMTRTVAMLEARGLVARSRHPTDGRQTVVTLTSAGRELLVADRRRRDAWLSRRFAELPAHELDALRAAAPVLDRLAQL